MPADWPIALRRYCRIETPEGKLRAVLFGDAVHGTTLTGDNYQLCGDYAGFAQEYVQERHPSVQAMFLMGCAGDANPYPRGSVALARATARRWEKRSAESWRANFNPSADRCESPSTKWNSRYKLRLRART